GAGVQSGDDQARAYPRTGRARPAYRARPHPHPDVGAVRPRRHRRLDRRAASDVGAQVRHRGGVPRRGGVVTAEGPTLRLERTFAASPERVFAAWTARTAA